MRSSSFKGSWLLANGDALIGSKAENIPLQKFVSSKPLHVIAQRCFTDIFKNVVELAEKLTTVEEHRVTTKDQKKTSDAKESSCLAFDEQTLATAQLRDQAKS
uniref:Uncharacterized protein n=1 Tax=Cannabis sativa TaxID=3483 RepID=A0A803PA08_CANSA